MRERLMCDRLREKALPSTWSSPQPGKRLMSKGSILVVDDESEIREGLELLLLDVSLPDRNGLDMLKEIHRRDPDLSVVLITAYGSIDMARAAFKNGAM